LRSNAKKKKKRNRSSRRKLKKCRNANRHTAVDAVLLQLHWLDLSVNKNRFSLMLFQRVL